MIQQLSIWKEQANPLVRMHNDLVTANFGYLELNAMRIFLLMLAKLNRDATDFTPVRISVHDIVPNYEGGATLENIIKACKELKTKIKDLEILSQHKGKTRYKIMTVIDYCEYITGTDYVEANFGIAIRPYLLQLKGNYTQAELRELLKLKSTYAIRMYMLIKSLYREGMIYETSVNEFRMMLVGNLTQYPDYRDFKKRVIQAPQTALQKTSCAFTIEEEKTGRNITKLRFIPAYYPEPRLSEQIFSDSLKSTLDELQVNLSNIGQLLQAGEISEDYIRFVVAAKQKDKKIKKLGGAIHDALVNKQLFEDYLKSTQKPASTSPRPTLTTVESDYTTISLSEAEKMYEQEKTAGKIKWAFAGFAKAMKTGRKIVIQGYDYK